MKQVKLLFGRIVLLLFLYSISRFIFFLFYYPYFSQSSTLEIIWAFFYGLRFDLSAILYTNAIFILIHILPWKFFQNLSRGIIGKILFYASNAIPLLLSCIDLAYFRFPLKRSTFDLFDAILLGDDIENTLPAMMMDFWYVILVFVALLLLANWLYNLLQNRILNEVNEYPPFWLRTMLFIGILPIFVVGVRGGLQLRPLGLMHAASDSPSNSQLILNTPFSILVTYGKGGIIEYDKESSDEPLSYYSLKRDYTHGQPFQMHNVVLIILENFSKEYVGAFNQGKGFTPFLDSIIPHSYVFYNAFANGKRSIEGIPSIIASIPPLMRDPFITSPYWGNNFNSIAHCLNKKNYSTTFFHGGTNGTMGFDHFSVAAGFQHYVGRTEYGNDQEYDGSWGIFDDSFFKFILQKIDASKEPFFSTVFSLSSHHPYSIPKKFKGKFPKGTLPIHESIGYTDYALQQFFAEAKQKPWFNNTLFVITADHTGPSDSPLYTNNIGKYAIPVIFYMPSMFLKGESNRVTQQIDIFPSILDLLKYDLPFNAFGKSAFDSSQRSFAINYANEMYQYMDDNYLLTFAGSKPISLHNYRNDPMIKTNIIDENFIVADSLCKQLKPIIRTFNSGMLNNTLSDKPVY